MTVVKRTTNELVIEDSDPALPAYSVRFVRDVAGQQVVSVQSTDSSTAESEQVGLNHADILAALSWLADAAGVERYVPDAAELGATGHQVDGDWEHDLTGAGDEDDDEDPPTCGAPAPTTDLPCLLEPEHNGRHLGLVWPR